MYCYYSFSDHIKGIFLGCHGRISAPTFVAAVGGLLFVSSFSFVILKFLCILLPHPLDVICMIGFTLTIIYSFFVLTMKRCHDLNLSGWFSLLMNIPILNVFFLLYLLFKSGPPMGNRFGSPNTYSLPKFYIILGYLITCLSLVTSLIVPMYLSLSGIDKNSTTLDVLSVLPLPESLRDAIFQNESVVVISSGERDIAIGFFISEDRFVVRGAASRLALQKELDRNISLKATRGGSEDMAYISRFIASDQQEGLLQTAVFEVDKPIGKPVHIDDKDKVHLQQMKAFK